MDNDDKNVTYDENESPATIALGCWCWWIAHIQQQLRLCVLMVRLEWLEWLGWIPDMYGTLKNIRCKKSASLGLGHEQKNGSPWISRR